ncbi:MAG: hypothetical protein Q9M24_03830, partial [Mariprofundaceae bacterium]|nr:hypothetical protein [Mariprofundaceae bacterium]
MFNVKRICFPALAFAVILSVIQTNIPTALADAFQNMETDMQHIEQRLPTGETPNVLLQGLSERDLARVQAEAKRVYAKLWPVFAERSRYVRDRILPVFEKLHAPLSLDVVPVIESGYNPYAFSSAGAM